MKLSEVIDRFGTSPTIGALEIGTPVEAIDAEYGYYHKGSKGTVVHYDEDGHMWVAFCGVEGVWCVTSSDNPTKMAVIAV